MGSQQTTHIDRATLTPNPIKNLTWMLAVLCAASLLAAACEVTESGSGGGVTEEDTADTSGGDGDSSGGDGSCGANPATTCLDTGCPTGERCVPLDNQGCRPSICQCQDGQWACTADCQQPVACVPEATCAAPNPADTCWQTGCPDGQQCVNVENGTCHPWRCACDVATGEWECTDEGQCDVSAQCVPVSACPGADPSLSCLDTGCPADQACVPSGDDGCRPSACGCDESVGAWACTADCQPLLHCAPVEMCAGPNPASSCLDTGCGRGEVCVPSNDRGCRPSSCVCDADTGTWACTEDCLENMTCAPDEASACEGPNPAITCEDTGCPDGQLCMLAETDGCVPSACSCDAATGAWLCTRDCGPMMACQASACGPYPTTCDMLGAPMPCGEGMVCDPQPWDAPPPCCTCDGAGGWSCTDDCMQVTGCKPAPAPTRCEGPNPSHTCEDTGCPDGHTCVPFDGDVCVPSACACDETTGEWLCTADCGGPMTCAPDNGRDCEGPNPAINCEDTGCPDGQACVPSPLTVCVPSSCMCDAATGQWACTDDCNQPMVCEGRP